MYADHFISIDSGKKAGEIPPGGKGQVNVQAGNVGNDTIVENSLEAIVSVGPNVRLKRLSRTGKNNAGILSAWEDWTFKLRGRGLGNTAVLRNKRGFASFDLSWVSLEVEASKRRGKFQTVTANISYILGKNPLLGNRQNAVQGNADTANDNSTTSFTVK